ncbi:tetratricopeptide repeat protein [Borreliella afzelii]|uniref:tetratricopeptide repeat protein n=1 Tax=Borreliella afzelii TaxID=29518 RepID=UPI003AF42DE3
MAKNNLLVFFIAIIFVFVSIIVVFYNSLSKDYVKSGGEIVENLEKDLNDYLKENDAKEREKISLSIKELILKEKEISSYFISRFYLAKAVYLQSQSQYDEAIKDLDIVIKAKGIESEIAFINKATIYEKMGLKEDALLVYEDLIKNTSLGFLKVRALLSKAILIEEKDKDLAVKVYEEIVKFPYENNLYINIANNKILELKQN